MNIIFFGSDNFAQAYMKRLIDSEHELVACVTQPDRPKGRGMKVIVSPIKECAQAQSIPVLQPSSLKDADFIKSLLNFQADLFVVIAYGKFLPPQVLSTPPHGAINVHASLLPKYRGAAPINWAIINGEAKTGISIIRINEEMDAGDILTQMEMDIVGNETAVTLRARMIADGPDFLLKTINGLASYSPEAQKASDATFAPKLTKELGRIEWIKPAAEIDCLVRGLLSWSSAYTSYKGKMLKILEAEVLDLDEAVAECGKVLEISKEGIVVATGDGGLRIQRVHFQDGKPMDAHSFVVGHKIELGYKFV